MLDFLSLKPESFGLDISDLSLKIIKLKKRGKKFDLSSFGEEKIKPGIIRGGEIKKEKELIKIIQKAIRNVKGGKLKTNYLIASLPEEKTFLQVIQMPRLSEEDLKSAVIYEAENYIPLPIEEVYLDSQIVPPVYNHLDHYDVLIVALPKNIVDPYLRCLKSAGLKPLAFEIESLATARALIKDEKTTSPVLIIDLGATKTSFIIFSGYSLRFTSLIPVSSQSFTNAISQTLKVSFNEAEKLKLKYGLITKASPKGGEVFDALIPSLTDLVEQIKKYLDYYQTHTSHEHLPPGNREVKKIILCGGGANLAGLPEFLSDQLNLEIELGNPWVNILSEKQKNSLKFPHEKSLSYTTALGLALRGLKND